MVFLSVLWLLSIMKDTNQTWICTIEKAPKFALEKKHVPWRERIVEYGRIFEYLHTQPSYLSLNINLCIFMHTTLREIFLCNRTQSTELLNIKSKKTNCLSFWGYPILFGLVVSLSQRGTLDNKILLEDAGSQLFSEYLIYLKSIVILLLKFDVKLIRIEFLAIET